MEKKSLEKIFNELYQIAKEKFDLKDIKISKTGTVGYLIYAMAYLLDNAQDYYEFLYRESLPITAQTYEALLTIGAMFGYRFQTARPASFVGKLYFYFPRYSQNKIDELHIPYNTRFTNDEGLRFTLYADLTIAFNRENNSVFGRYFKPEHNKYETVVGTIEKVDENFILVSIPARHILQSFTEEEIFTVPYYPMKSNYIYKLQYDNKKYQLADIKVFNLDRNDLKYKIDNIKVLYSSDDDVVFISQKDRNEFYLILPDGIYGRYIPQGTTLKIVKYLTEGSKGNVVYGSKFVFEGNTHPLYSGAPITDNNLLFIQTTKDLNDGKDIKSINELRKDIIELIRTKKTLITEDDFIEFGNLNKNDVYVFKFDFGFNSSDVVFFSPLLDDSGAPFETITLSLTLDQLNQSTIKDNNQILLFPEHKLVLNNTISDSDFNSTYDIKLTQDVNDENQNYIVVNDVSHFSVNDKIALGAPDSTEQLFTITQIDNKNKKLVLDRKIGKKYSQGTKVYKLKNEEVNLISPFIYIKNELNNSYEAIYFDPNSYHFSVVEIKNKDAALPKIDKFEIKVTDISKTDKKLKLKFKIHIANKNKLDYEPEIIFKTPNGKRFIFNSDNNFENEIELFSSTDNNAAHSSKLTFLERIVKGLNNFDFEIELNDKNSGENILKGALVLNLFDNLKDVLKLKIKNNTLVHIPFLNKDKLDEDEDRKNYILNKLKNMVKSVANQIQNRAPGIDTKFSLPNTIEINNPKNYLIPQEDNGEKCHYKNIRFPIKTSLKLKLGAPITNEELSELKKEIAKTLKSAQGFFTSLSPTNLINTVKEKLKDKVFDVSVKSPGAPISTNPNYEKDLIKKDKNNALHFCPPYFYYDIDNINIDAEVIAV